MDREEIIVGKLKDLFKMRGFRNVKVNKFEEYSLYLENRNFFDSQNIITFTGIDGRLMALKPDVTLSIIKNFFQDENELTDKFYYLDEIYRFSKDVNQYKATEQIGVEVIGPKDTFVNIEIIDLAIESLKSIDGEFMLDVSHLGFVSSLLNSLNISDNAKEDILNALYSKSKHKIEQILADIDLDEERKAYVLKLSSLSGNLREVLPKALEMMISEEMKAAYEELNSIKAVLEKTNLIQYVNLDFSVVNDLDYYNGLIFKGYIKDISKAVLSGGRYDNLARKMGKKSCAIGFAITLSEICETLVKENEREPEILLTYDADCNYPDLLSQMKAWIAQGRSVEIAAFRGRRSEVKEWYHFTKSGLERKDNENA